MVIKEVVRVPEFIRMQMVWLKEGYELIKAWAGGKRFVGDSGAGDPPPGYPFGATTRHQGGTREWQADLSLLRSLWLRVVRPHQQEDLFRRGAEKAVHGSL